MCSDIKEREGEKCVIQMSQMLKIKPKEQKNPTITTKNIKKQNKRKKQNICERETRKTAEIEQTGGNKNKS